MTIFKPLAGLRKAATRPGDTMQRIAARELDDAARWTELISVNDLEYPWITDDPALAGPKVLLAGLDILIPAPAPEASGVVQTSDDAVFGADLKLTGGRLGSDGMGGLSLISGAPNLTQATDHRLQVKRGSVLFHRPYGSELHLLIGGRADPVSEQLGALFVERALLQDPRIDRVENARATINGDAIETSATAIAVDGRRVPAGSNPA